jgi:large subunit ribosomal protein L28
MSRVCQILGKKTVFGNNVSNSNVKTKRKFLPNLQNKKFFSSEKGFWVLARVSTKAIRTINKIGFESTLRKAKKNGTLCSQLHYLVS